MGGESLSASFNTLSWLPLRYFSVEKVTNEKMVESTEGERRGKRREEEDRRRHKGERKKGARMYNDIMIISFFLFSIAKRWAAKYPSSFPHGLFISNKRAPMFIRYCRVPVSGDERK